MNNYQFFFFLAVSITALSLITLAVPSHAQSSPEKQLIDTSYGAFIFVQTFLHNSNGQLITYMATDTFTNIDSKLLENLLDSEANDKDPIITLEGKKYQVINRKLIIPYDKENVIASTIIAHSQEGKLKTVARFAHDGYPIEPGDKVTSIWTFIRPID